MTFISTSTEMFSVNEIFIKSSVQNFLAGKLYRDYGKERDISKSPRTIFSEYLKNRDKTAEISPYFCKDSIYFYYIQRCGLFFVIASEHDIPPVFVFEVLTSLFGILQDFLGSVNEESLVTNSILVYEILDETIDNGYLQTMSTEKLRPYIHSSVQHSNRGINASLVPPHVLGIDKRLSSAIQQQPSTNQKRDEIFIDVIERLSVFVRKDAKLERIEVIGCIKIKNSVSSCQELKLTLNENISIGSDVSNSLGGEVKLNKCIFQPSVNAEHFKRGILKLKPVIGENTVMNYTVSGPIALHQPFFMHSSISILDQTLDLLLNISIKSSIPEDICAINLEICIPLPHGVNNISHHLNSCITGETSSYDKSRNTLVWVIPTFSGCLEVKGQFQLINNTGVPLEKESLGPASFKFEISKYTSTGLKIKNLQLGVASNLSVKKWIRHLTLADSYVVQI